MKGHLKRNRMTQISASYHLPLSLWSKRTAENHLDFGKNALLYIVHGFWPKSEKFDFGKKGYHMKGHLKRNTMTQISASYHLPLWSKRTAENHLDFGKNALL